MAFLKPFCYSLLSTLFCLAISMHYAHINESLFMEQKTFFSQGSFIILTSLIGIATGLYIGYQLPASTIILTIAQTCSKLFIDLIQLISLPIIFLSILATVINMESFEEMKRMGKKVLKYTLLTTIISAIIGLILFLLIDPTRSVIEFTTQASQSLPGTQAGYFSFLLSIIPDNIVKAFSDNKNVMSIVFIAGLLSFSILSLPREQKKTLQQFFGGLFSAILNITKLIIFIMPFAVWAFITTFTNELFIQQSQGTLTSLLLYISCIIGANLLQGVIVLPLFLRTKNISPLQAFKGMYRALTLAFFSKSSNATLPVTIKCAQENMGVSPKVANFSLPLCSVINMNGCAAFILITVLFVAMKSGITFSAIELIAWIFIASLAALGNAGVPMGCYFLSSALLVGMNIPQEHLHILFVILPLYTIIDMVETALNVWSDSCVTMVVDKELSSIESKHV